MSIDELFLLYKLHQLDWSIYQIRQQASKVGVPSHLTQQYQKQKQNASLLIKRVQELETDYKDLSLKQQTLQERQKNIEKELYIIGITPREVETLQKELKNIHQQIEEYETELLKILEDLPEAQQKADEIKKPILELEQQIKEQHTSALNLKNALQTKFNQLQALRPQIVEKVPTLLLNEYQSLLKKLNGVAMSEVTSQKTCQMCGTKVPERFLEACKNGKKIQCESCRKILYLPPGDL